MNNTRKLAAVHFIFFLIFWTFLWVGTRITSGEQGLLIVPGVILATVLTIVDFIWIMASDNDK
jgi:heme/copper-type cytochrome/quinol oxidase subunit 4